ncbi:hypothetical protein ACELLULO517_15745 [Acidisoma cellulosilytica]|uniref:Rap1a immunity protein domain-containing protein n=1 Tax=Acidisoma cellulosilyticum TaxID=2802395 RepID=A0A964E4Q4_9PROT|nr:hypothetical protein [Acidisoma cellulosilyticum]MCB8881701.1 hypothetical protein [Acidisoma cellulosilyticum]
MFRKALLFGFVAGLATSSPALARENPPGEFQIFGVGGLQCSDYLLAVENERAAWIQSGHPRQGGEALYPAYIGYLQYMAGALTLTSFSVNKSFSVTIDTAMDVAENYCRAHPARQYIESVMSVTNPST